MSIENHFTIYQNKKKTKIVSIFAKDINYTEVLKFSLIFFLCNAQVDSKIAPTHTLIQTFLLYCYSNLRDGT